MSPRITAPLTAGGTTIAALDRGVVVIEAAERSGIPDHRLARQRPGPPAGACPRPCYLRDIGWLPRAHPRPARRLRDQRRRYHRARATASGYQQELGHRPQPRALASWGSRKRSRLFETGCQTRGRSGLTAHAE